MAARRQVSILVVVDDGRRPLSPPDRVPNIARVSILVVVDDGRRRYRAADTVPTNLKFQSLLLWMTVVDIVGAGLLSHSSRVSILVVVDDGRRHRAEDRAKGRNTGFNPCCCG